MLKLQEITSRELKNTKIFEKGNTSPLFLFSLKSLFVVGPSTEKSLKKALYCRHRYSHREWFLLRWSLRRLQQPFRWFKFCQLCLRPCLQRCSILKVSLHSKLWAGHRSPLVSRRLDYTRPSFPPVASIRSSTSPTVGDGSCCTRKSNFSRISEMSSRADPDPALVLPALVSELFNGN